MKKILIVLICLGLAGCGTLKTVTMKHYDNHVAREKEIEAAYQDGDITKKEYLDLKLRNDKIYRGESTDVKVRHSSF